MNIKSIIYIVSALLPFTVTAQITARPIPPVTYLKNDQLQNKTVFNIPLQFYNPKLGNFNEPCSFAINVNGKKFFEYELRPPYEFQVPIDDDFTGEVQIEWDSKVTAGSTLFSTLVSKIPVCIAKGDIYTSELYANAWKRVERRMNQISPEAVTCISSQMTDSKLPYYTSRVEGVSVYPGVNHPTAQKVISACTKIYSTNLKKNYQCSLANGGRSSTCEDSWYENRDGRTYKLTQMQAVKRLLSDSKIEVTGFETVVAANSYKEQVAQNAAAVAKKEAEAEQRRKWLETPEGKKYLADEAAKTKKAEDERRAADAAEKLKSDKKNAEENAKKEKIRQQCEKMNAWASDSREIISGSLNISMNSISLVRFEMWKNCLAIIDTPKGPNKCQVMDIIEDKKSGTYFADMGMRPYRAPICGGLAF